MIKWFKNYLKRRKRLKRGIELANIGWNKDVDKLSLLIAGALDDDPWIREAATGAMMQLGKASSPAKEVLIKVIKDYVNEGCSRNAVWTLSIIGDKSKEIMDVLWYAIGARNSCCMEDAAILYMKFNLVQND